MKYNRILTERQIEVCDCREKQMKVRNAYIDALRIIAVFFVLFNHQDGFYLYLNASPIKTFIYSCISVLTRMNVPTFMLISGALLLGREESISRVLKKRCLKFFMLMLFFSMVYYVVIYKTLDINFIYKFIYGDIHYSYWYLYAHMGFLIILPYVRNLVLNLRKEDINYIFVIHFAYFSLVPIINYCLTRCGMTTLTISKSLEMPVMICSMIFYPILGYYLDKKLDIMQLTRKQIVFVSVIAVMAIVVPASITTSEVILDGYSKWYLQLFDYLLAASLFLLIKYVFHHWKWLSEKRKFSKIITTIGSLTLGMYLLDPVVKPYVNGHVTNFLNPYLPTILVSASYCLISMAIGGGITYILQKLPLVKKIF